jgi:hypothetical protein
VNIDSDPVGDIIISGAFDDSLMLGSYSFYCDDTAANQGDVFTAKMSGAFTSASDQPVSAGINVYPNPSSGIFTISFGNRRKDTEFFLYDILGNRLLSNRTGTGSAAQLDLDSYPKGIYFLEIMTDKESSVRKIVLQ